MTAAGCPIDEDAVWRLEGTDPPEGATASELAALATVFRTDAAELLRPIDQVEMDRTGVLLVRLAAMELDVADALTHYADAYDDFQRDPGDNPPTSQDERELRRYAAERAGEATGERQRRAGSEPSGAARSVGAKQPDVQPDLLTLRLLRASEIELGGAFRVYVGVYQDLASLDGDPGGRAGFSQDQEAIYQYIMERWPAVTTSRVMIDLTPRFVM
jgi:hypothetical protein